MQKIKEFETEKVILLFVSMPYWLQNYKTVHYEKGYILLVGDIDNASSGFKKQDDEYEYIGMADKLKPKTITSKIGISNIEYIGLLEHENITSDNSGYSDRWAVYVKKK